MHDLALVLFTFSISSASQTCLPCDPRDVVMPRPGRTVLANNGVRWPTLCMPATPEGEEEHVFTIGDWGGMGKGARTFDNTARKRSYVWGTDDVAQHSVASLMKHVANTSKPKYILNIGDNFYPGGIEANCADVDMCSYVQTGQWENDWENIYDGPLKDLEWWGCLGNHDFGGFSFQRAWDQQIAFTWHHDRWLLPAMYWERRVVYCSFSVDYYFLDSNFFDTKDPKHDPNHNICSREHNQKTCAVTGGPIDSADCVKWFENLFAQQLYWLEARLSHSTADWQIIVTHFPPQYGQSIWADLARRHGVDLFVTGHRHQQEVHYMEGIPGFFTMDMGGAAWIVTGGGGGVTSEGNPLLESAITQQYGFMDLTLSKERIHIDMWSAVTRRMRRRVTINKNLPSAHRRLRNIKSSGHQRGAAAHFEELNKSNDERCSATRRRMSIMNRLSTLTQAEDTKPADASHMILDIDAPASDILPSDYLDMVAGLSIENCFQHCGNRSGYCEHFCGMGKACCNQGNLDTDSKECKTANVFVQTSKYECVGIRDTDGNLFLKRVGAWPPPIEETLGTPGPGSAQTTVGVNAPASLPPLRTDAASWFAPGVGSGTKLGATQDEDGSEQTPEEFRVRDDPEWGGTAHRIFLHWRESLLAGAALTAVGFALLLVGRPSFEHRDVSLRTSSSSSDDESPVE